MTEQGGGRSITARYEGHYDLYRAQSPGQTLGPFFHQGLLRTRQAFQLEHLCSDERDVFSSTVAGPDTRGQRIGLSGQVLDGLVKNGILSIAQHHVNI